MTTDRAIEIISQLAIFLSFLMIYWHMLSSLRRRSSLFAFSLQDSPSVIDIILWAQELSVSLDHLKSTYEWRINQWSKFSDAILTATLAFVSTVVISVLKNEIHLEKSNTIYVICAGPVLSIFIYSLCQQEITRLRREFTALFKILSLLHRG